MDKKEIKTDIAHITRELDSLWKQWADITDSIKKLVYEKNLLESDMATLRRRKDELEESLDDGALYGTRQDIRWRGKDGKVYYFIYRPDSDAGVDDVPRVCKTYEAGERIDEIRWNNGNYFRTREEAIKALWTSK